MSKENRILDEVFVSCDIETDGPIPGPHSMLSTGLVAFSLRRGIFDELEYNLDLLPGAQMHHKTKTEFWDKHPDLYAATRVNTIAPKAAMENTTTWAKSISPSRAPVFVGYPAGFDFTFFHWYSVYFTGEDPFGFAAFDMKSYASATLKKAFRDIGKRDMPKSWFAAITAKHSHIAVEDAREQAHICIAMMKQNLGIEE